MKKTVIIIFIFLFSIFFIEDVNAAVTGKKCAYGNATVNSIGTIDFHFLNDGTSKFLRTHNNEQTDVSIENGTEIIAKYKENGVCPPYIAVVTKFSENWKAKYIGIETNESFDNYQGMKDLFTMVEFVYYLGIQDITDGKNPEGNANKIYENVYKPSISNTFGELNVKVRYNEVEGVSLSQLFSFSKGQTPTIIYGNRINYIETILNKIHQDNWPKDIYCGEINAALTLKNHEVIVGSGVSNGSLVCSFDKNLFNDGTNKLIRYSTDYTSTVPDTPEEDGPSTDNPSGGNTGESNSNEDEDITSISTGMICKSPNLKTPLKYVGWLLSVIKIIVPLIIIILGVVDYLKAVASQKSDEMLKATKVVALRVIAGVIIFFIPMFVNFFFTLVDDWSNYKTAYSECTICLYEPRKC